MKIKNERGLSTILFSFLYSNQNWINKKKKLKRTQTGKEVFYNYVVSFAEDG